MKILTNSLFFLFLIIANCSHAPMITQFPTEGTWLNESYINALQDSYSPQTAAVVAEISSIQIDKNLKTMMIGFNFHEGINYTIENIDRLSGNFRLTEPTYGIKSITYINERIRVTYESNHYRIVSTEFFRISPLRNQDVDVINPYVAQIVFFGGEYRDAADRVYTFGPSIVNWDGQPYEYTIQLDFIEFTPMDAIWIRKKGSDDPWKPYCFATNGNILDLYEYDYDNKTVGKNVISLLRK